MIVAPRQLHNSREQRQLMIAWQDGEQHCISHQALRAACRCATCRAQVVRGTIALIDADLHIEKVNNLGQGLQLIFSDGHARGIFPWQYLYELGKQS